LSSINSEEQNEERNKIKRLEIESNSINEASEDDQPTSSSISRYGSRSDQQERTRSRL